MFSRTIRLTVSPSATATWNDADVAAALDQRDDGALAAGARLAALGVGPIAALLGRPALLDRAEVGLVGLDDAALAAHRAGEARPTRMASRMRWLMNQAAS